MLFSENINVFNQGSVTNVNRQTDRITSPQEYRALHWESELEFNVPFQHKHGYIREHWERNVSPICRKGPSGAML